MNPLSASQLKTYQRCPRRWFYNYVQGDREPGSESTTLGSAIHKEMEEWLKEGKLPKLPQARALVKHTPAPGIGLVETPIAFSTFGDDDYEVQWRGFIDLLYCLDPNQGFVPYDAHGHVVIHDHKSTKDLDYAKSEAQLIEDEQANIYAYWAYSEGAETVGGQWNYVQTKGVPEVLPVTFTLELDKVEEVMGRCHKQGVEIQKLYQLGKKAELDIPQNIEDCGSFRKPCPFLSQCKPFEDEPRKPFRLRSEVMSDFENAITAITTGSKAPPPPPPKKAPPPPPPKRDTADVQANAAVAKAALNALFVDRTPEPEKGFINPPDAPFTEAAATPEDAIRIQGIVAPEEEETVEVSDELDGLELHQLKAIATQLEIPLSPRARTYKVKELIRFKRKHGSLPVETAPVVAQSGFKAIVAHDPEGFAYTQELTEEFSEAQAKIQAEVAPVSLAPSDLTDAVLSYTIQDLATRLGCEIVLTFRPKTL